MAFSVTAQSLTDGLNFVVVSPDGIIGYTTYEALRAALGMSVTASVTVTITPTSTSTVTPPPGTPLDFVIDSVAFAPPSPAAGEPILARAVVRNAGGTAAGPGTVIGVGFRSPAGVNPPLAWHDTYDGGLAPGASITLTANSGTFTLGAGTIVIEAHVDDIDRWGALETNKANNFFSATLVVGAAPPASTSFFVDVEPTTLTFNPGGSLNAGVSVTFLSVVQNSGNIPVNGGVCEFRVNGSLVASPALPAIGAGASSTLSTAWTTQAGTNVVTATLVGVTGNTPS